jgi:hypothetical protein
LHQFCAPSAFIPVRAEHPGIPITRSVIEFERGCKITSMLVNTFCVVNNFVFSLVIIIGKCVKLV